MHARACEPYTHTDQLSAERNAMTSTDRAWDSLRIVEGLQISGKKNILMRALVQALRHDPHYLISLTDVLNPTAMHPLAT